jgi:hypothetical protein
MTEQVTDTLLTGQDNTDTGAGNADVNANADTQQNAEVVEGAGAETQQAEGDQSNQDQAITYEDFVVPEGLVLDEEVMGEFLPFAQELKLDQAGAQKLVDMGSQLATKMQQQALNAWQEQIAGWQEQTRNDPELGGKNLAATLASGRAALESFGTPAFNQMLKDSGIGNHVEMIRFMNRIGNEIGNDSIVTGAQTSAGAEGMYSYMNKS